MLVALLLVGCGAGEPQPNGSAVVVDRPEPVTTGVPARRTRSLALDAVWGGPPVLCEPPCAVVPVGSVQATSARAGHPAEHAVDGDPATSWCGTRGRRDQLLVRFDPRSTVDSVVVHAVGVAKLTLTTDRWDEATLTVGPPADGASPPYARLELDEVGLVNLEIAALHDGGAGCIEELAFTSLPSVR